MRRTNRMLRSCTAAALFLAGGACFATPDAAGADPVAAVQSAYARAVPAGEATDRFKDLYTLVFQRVQRAYATDVDVPSLAAAALKVLEPLPEGAGEPGDVFRRSVNAALRTLDAYSRYIDAQSHQNERSESSGMFGGVGLELETSDGRVRVVAAMPGGPAARAGVQPGDIIVGVDDQPLTGVPLSEAIGRMRGEPGTPLKLTLRRTAGEVTVALTRETIRRQALTTSTEGDVLVVRLTTFSAPVTAALRQAIADATAGGLPKGFILDMRGNGGGLFREALGVADTFLTKGDIVSLRGRTPSNQRTWAADAEEMLPGVPMAVLVDRRSASASELVAAALQENGRATVLGERSFGKGSVQSTYSLGDQRGALRLTTAIYHGPSGRTVQKAGLDPDVELVADATAADQQAAAAAVLLPGESRRLRVAHSRCAAQSPAPDPVLACAATFVRSGSFDAFAAAMGAAPR